MMCSDVTELSKTPRRHVYGGMLKGRKMRKSDNSSMRRLFADRLYTDSYFRKVNNSYKRI